MQFQQQLKLSTNEAVVHIMVGFHTAEIADTLYVTTVQGVQAADADNPPFVCLTS